jgi:hypothetical protein
VSTGPETPLTLAVHESCQNAAVCQGLGIGKQVSIDG